MSRVRPAALSLLVALSLVACSEDDDPDKTAALGGFPAAFDGFCRGELKTTVTVQPSLGSGAWGGTNLDKAVAPQPFLLGSSFDEFEGYLFLSNGAPARLSKGVGEDLIKDTDFTTTCDTSRKPLFTLLANGTLYADESLTGTPCTLPRGQSFPDHAYARTGGQAATFSSSTLKDLCGFEKGYSVDLVYASLLPR